MPTVKIKGKVKKFKYNKMGIRKAKKLARRKGTKITFGY